MEVVGIKEMTLLWNNLDSALYKIVIIEHNVYISVFSLPCILQIQVFPVMFPWARISKTSCHTKSKNLGEGSKIVQHRQQSQNNLLFNMYSVLSRIYHHEVHTGRAQYQ